VGSEMNMSSRRYDVDWLRVLVIIAVFIFHSGRFFDLTDWHVKSPVVYASVQAWTTFLVGWLMPLIFVISGASLFYAVGKGGVLAFMRDKVLRLLVPLVVGVFTHVALAVYLERVSHHQFSGSFLSFYPHYFDGMYAFGGNFAWMGLHLWYLLVLFLCSIIFLPLFYLFKGPARGALRAFGSFLAMPGAVFVLVIPVAWLSMVLDPRSGLGQRGFGGWPVPVYVCYLFYGFIIFSHERLQEQIERMRPFHLCLALAASAFLLWWFRYLPPGRGAKVGISFGFPFLIGSWSWMLAFMGFARAHLTRSTPFLAYANEAVLPFYIMHQTVLLVVGYLVLPWHIPDPAKWLVIAAISFAVVMAIYEFAVRRSNVLRVLFGMKVIHGRPQGALEPALCGKPQP